MAVGNDKMAPQGSATMKSLTLGVAGDIDLTAAVLHAVQIPFSFLVLQVQLYCRVVVDVYTMIVGVVRPGRAIQAVTLVIGTTTTKFKLNAALDLVMPTRTSIQTLPAVLHKAIADNIAFSSAFTINGDATAGIWYGAVRVQMDVNKVVTTKVVADDQQFNNAATARAMAPAADADKFDMGLIVIPAATGVTFTAQTDDLNGAHVGTVLYEGTAAGFVNVLESDPAFASAQLVTGEPLDALYDGSVSQAGGLLVIQATSSHTGVLTDATVDVQYRAWPLDGEVAPATQE